MRVTIEGNLSLAETKELIQAVQAIEQHDSRRVVSLIFHDPPDVTVEEWLALLRELGLPHAAIVPTDREIELEFERGGGVRLVPQDPEMKDAV